MSTAAAEIHPEEIRLQWREARGGTPSTATMNFIVYVENEQYRDWVLSRTQRLADKHPSRVIVLDAVKGRNGVEITTGEGGASGGPSIFRERVDLGVDGIRAARRVQFVESLLVKDIPTVLFWAADRLFESNTFKALLPLMQHVILDSSGSGKEPNALREFAGFFSEHRAAALDDLAWMRLEPWRDVVAQFFDPPDVQGELFSLRSIAIASGSESEALYLGCWLASRLGWTVRDASGFADRAGAPIAFARRREGEIRRVRSVELKSATSTYQAYVAGEGDAICLEVAGRFQRPPQHVPLQAIDNMSLIERAILNRHTDQVFLEALRMAGALLG
jgi:glucose-6-phosphate dehydrogenase assembly protein OpcA